MLPIGDAEVPASAATSVQRIPSGRAVLTEGSVHVGLLS